MKLLLLTIAGGAGTLCRYLLSVTIEKRLAANFPWHTFAVNVLGCFAAGLLVAYFKDNINWSEETKLILLTGFLGAFTTFSTYINESGELFQSGNISTAILHLGMHNLFGLIAVFLGYRLCTVVA